MYVISTYQAAPEADDAFVPSPQSVWSPHQQEFIHESLKWFKSQIRFDNMAHTINRCFVLHIIGCYACRSTGGHSRRIQGSWPKELQIGRASCRERVCKYV